MDGFATGLSLSAVEANCLSCADATSVLKYKGIRCVGIRPDHSEEATFGKNRKFKMECLITAEFLHKNKKEHKSAIKVSF